MGFLDNSGDILLDAVLTDAGRARMAKGDGSFRITRFALGDDEINYALYDRENPNGSSNFDTTILQTPIFEAFTNNIASLNSRLISIPRNNLLFLPVIKPNNLLSSTKYAINKIVQNGYIVTTTTETFDIINNTNIMYDSVKISKEGIINGFSPASGGDYIRLDQGIDNEKYSPEEGLQQDLIETQYLLEVDNRFLVPTTKQGAMATYSYIDDDNIAAYYFSLDNLFVSTNTEKGGASATDSANRFQQVIAGARGTYFEFSLKAASDLVYSDYLFKRLGTNITNKLTGTGIPQFSEVRSINTNITITGLTTGYSVSIPIVLMRKIN